MPFRSRLGRGRCPYQATKHRHWPTCSQQNINLNQHSAENKNFMIWASGGSAYPGTLRYQLRDPAGCASRMDVPPDACHGWKYPLPACPVAPSRCRREPRALEPARGGHGTAPGGPPGDVSRAKSPRAAKRGTRRATHPLITPWWWQPMGGLSGVWQLPQRTPKTTGS